MALWNIIESISLEWQFSEMKTMECNLVLLVDLELLLDLGYLEK